MIYFVQAEGVGLIKIGVADDVYVRLLCLRRMSPVPLHCLGVMAGGLKEERRLHLRFRRLRSHDEWFWPTRELTSFIGTGATPFHEPPARHGRSRRGTPNKTMLYCPDGYSEWLIAFATAQRTSIAGVVDAAARHWARQEGCDLPPELPGELLLEVGPERPRSVPQILVVGTQDWRAWFNGVADEMGFDVNKLMRAMLAAYADHIGFSACAVGS